VSEQVMRVPGESSQAVALEHAAASHGHGGHAHDEHDEHHGALHHHFEDMAQQRESISLGMWGFLATEVMMFGGLFFVYALYRWAGAVKAHQAGMLDPFSVGSSLLNHNLGLFNTFVLLFSSLSMAMAVHYAAEQNRKMLIRMLALTWILGLAFLVIKGFEWSHDWHVGLIPSLNWNPIAYLSSHGIDPTNVNLAHLQMYFVIYFCMTGLHAIHMVIGLGVVFWVGWLASKGHFEGGNDQPVEILGLYWHFVDIVWVFLFPLLYLIAGAAAHGGGH
jgi:cytochrome c oxidase subunit III